MPTDQPTALRIALLGVDGSGKSTVARILARGSAPSRDRVVLSSLRPHENADAPLQTLSRHLDTLSEEADRLASPDLKLAVLYLQMCTYGVAERFFTGELSIRTVISERHPIIDALVYLPLYRHSIDQITDPGRPEALRGQLAAMPVSAVEAALAWSRSLSRPARLDTLGAELVALLDLPVAEQIAELSARFTVDPPDVAVLLDIDVTEAVSRVRARDRRPELHERPELLSLVHDGYERALEALDSVKVHRIRVDGRSPESLAAEVAHVAGL